MIIRGIEHPKQETDPGYVILTRNVAGYDRNEALVDRLIRIEQILGISGRDRIMEQQFPILKELGETCDANILKLHHTLQSHIRMATENYRKMLEECNTMHKLQQDNC